MRFQIEHRNCRIHGTPHMHVRACPRCLAPLVNGECPNGCMQSVSKPLGTWGESERWKCVEGLA